MRTSFLMTALLCLALAAQSCGDSSLFPIDPGGDKNPDKPTKLTTEQIIGQEWQLKSIQTIGGTPTSLPALTEVPADQLITLKFNDKKNLGGNADCNAYAAEYTAGANYSIAISAYIATDAYCGSESLDQEYVKGLNSAVTYEATTEMLRIFYDGGKRVLNFVKRTTTDNGQTEKRAPITDMLGTTWKLVSFETVGSATTLPSVSMIIDGEVFTLMVNTAYTNHLEGTANCNTYDGQFNVGPNYAFNVYGVGSTKMSCFLDNLAGQYFSALNDAESAVIVTNAQGTSLLVYYDHGRQLLRYEKSDPIPVEGPADLSSVSGVRWRLTAIGTTGGGMKAPATTDPNMIPWIMFDASGTMNGAGYCTQLTADYSDATGSGMEIRNLKWNTYTLCQYDESEFRNALQTARSYKLTDTDLLIYSDNYGLMSFVRE